jgi:NAD(P)H dehydrogenase (quinone)
MNVLVAYHSEDGHTEMLAQAVAEGAREAGAQVETRSICELNSHDLRRADGLLLGCPVYSATVSYQMKQFIDTMMGQLWMNGELAGKAGGAFATCAGQHGGIETTLDTLLRALLGFNMVVTGPYLPQEEIKFAGSAYGATFVAESAEAQLSQSEWKLARGLGRRVAEVAAALAQSGAAAAKEGGIEVGQ